MIWRYERVLGTIVATGITKARVLALGPAQQRRIAAGLR
jgi:hypothetical protein